MSHGAFNVCLVTIIYSAEMFQEWTIRDMFCDPNEFYDWIDENTSHDWTILGIPHKNTLSYFIFFEDETDATAFKLKWL